MIKVIIIEDEPLIAKMYEKGLKKEDFETIVAIGGREGIERVKKEKPDLVLLDLMMQEPDGMQVLSNLKSDAETKAIPVIILTNVAGENDRELAMIKGAKDFWSKKDINPLDLGEKIKEILNKA